MLTLRPIESRDTTEVQRLVADPAVGIPANFRHPFHQEDAVEFIEDRIAAFEEGNAFTFVITKEGNLVGCCSLHTVCWATRSAEIGFWIGRSYWGQGLASAAVCHLLGVAFSDLRLVFLSARCLEHNRTAERILLKNGFSFVESGFHKSLRRSRPMTISVFQLGWKDWVKNNRLPRASEW